MDIDNSAARLSEALGKVLYRYRSENGLTREELASMLELSEGRIRQLEGGDNAKSFRIELLLSVAQTLGIPAHNLLKQIMEEAKLISGGQEAKSLEAAFNSALQTFLGSEAFHESLNREDEIFGNHFRWSLKMAELLLQLDNPAKARLEMALRREAPKGEIKQFKKRMEVLLDYDLDN